MILKILLFALFAYFLYEFIEHAVLPLFWLITKKQKRSVTGASGLIGEIGEVREWSGSEGRIFVHGELWKATSKGPFLPGDKVVVQNVQGLMLIVRPYKKADLRL